MRTDLGKSGVRVMGTWSSATAYEKNDIVTNGGDGYISITDVPVGTALSNTSYWMQIVNGFSESEVTSAVNAWLVAHPEATTTVQDGAVTTAKIADGAVTDEKLAQSGGVLSKVADLTSDLNLTKNNLIEVSGNPFDCVFERGMRSVNNGADTWSNTSTRISTKRGTYLNFKAGDKVYLLDSANYQYLVGLSYDGGTTWTGGSNTNRITTIQEDAIGFICLRAISGSFADNIDYTQLAHQTIEIRRNVILNSNISLTEGLWDAINNASGFEVNADNGRAEIYVNTTAGNKSSGGSLLCQSSAKQGDIFAIKLNASVSYPNNYSRYGFVLYEKNSANTTVASKEITSLSDVNEYTVTNAKTVKIGFLPFVTTETGAIESAYYESFRYEIVAVKKGMNEIESMLTESGATWEV